MTGSALSCEESSGREESKAGVLWGFWSLASERAFKWWEICNFALLHVPEVDLGV